MRQKALLTHKCVSNNPSSIITDEVRGEIVCGTCGSVLKEKIVDNIQEYRTFTKNQYMGRTRAEGSSKLSMDNMGLSTRISKLNTDSAGNRLSNKTKTRFSRLRTWDTRSKRKSKQRSMVKAFVILDSLITKLSLPESVSENAAYIYRKASDLRLIKGRTISAMIASALYAACRESSAPRSVDDVAKAANVQKKSLTKCYRTLVKNLNLTYEPHDPISFVSKIATQINASEKSMRTAWRLLTLAQEHGMNVSKKPLGLAGGAVYLACALNGENVTYSTISKISNTSSVTLRKHVDALKKLRSQL